MNVNEVIATLTGGRAHPNDHVNMGQSSNDVMPAAVQLAACELITRDLVPALEATVDRCRRLAAETGDVVKPGRTHLMDAVPVLLGDEFESYAAQLAECVEHVSAARRSLARLPLGGTAVGNGLGAHPELATRVVERLATAVRLGVELELPASRLARQGAHDALVATSGATNVLAVALDEDRERSPVDVVRAEHRPGRDRAPGVAEGLVDHAGQGEPGGARGRAAGGRTGDR